MGYSFAAHGHPNITAKHKNTIEFTKDKNVTLNGDCIIGINSDFNLKEIKELIKNNNKLKIIIKVDGIIEEINCQVNPDFDDETEIVIRKSGFVSKRTLGIKADKACSDLKRDFVRILSNPNTRFKVNFVTLK